EGGASGGDWFGLGMWHVEDLDADGIDDIVVGAPGPGAGKQYHGRAFAVYGPGFVTATELQHAGPVLVAVFGLYGDVADLDGDTLPEILVGSQGWPNGGRIDVFDGATGFTGPP